MFLSLSYGIKCNRDKYLCCGMHVTGMIVKKIRELGLTDCLTDRLIFFDKYEPSNLAGQWAELLDLSGYMVVCKVSYDNERGKHLQNLSTATLEFAGNLVILIWIMMALITYTWKV